MSWGGRRPGSGRKPGSTEKMSQGRKPKAPPALKPQLRDQALCARPGCGNRFRKNRDAQQYCSARCVGMVFGLRATGGRRAGSGRKPKPIRQAFCAREGCSASFVTKRESQRFCSIRCAALANDANRQPRGGVIHTERHCRLCGKPFHSPVPAQFLCSQQCGRAWVRQQYSNPDKALVRRARRALASRMRRARGGRTVVNRWGQICERDGWRCWICGAAIDPAARMPHPLAGTADHVVPLLLGGSDDDSNLRAAHFQCNSRRQAGLPATTRRG